VILYHAIALWIPTIGGTIGFARLRRAIARRPAALSTVPAAQAVLAEGPREDGLAA
jgi:hypothetical protein